MFSEYRKTRSDPTVLVTGASGYVATHVVQQLQQAGYKVRGTVRSLGNEERIAPLRKLCPGAKHPIELVEADLLKPESWDKAVEGCKYVMHMASPFPMFGAMTDPENEVIKPAVEGTRTVLKACAKAKVTRVVLTGSAANITGDSDPPSGPITEDVWTNVEKTEPYSQSKTLAERAAWDLVKDLPEDQKFELVVVHPAMVMGPPLCAGGSTSISMAMGLLTGAMTTMPSSFMGWIDVRDVAKSHIQGMLVPEAAGHRHLLISDCRWLADVAKFLTDEFSKQGYNVTSEVGPNQGGPYSKEVQLMNTRMREVLKVEPRPLQQTMVEMAYSLIEQGRVPKTDKYTGVPEGVKIN